MLCKVCICVPSDNFINWVLLSMKNESVIEVKVQLIDKYLMEILY